MKDALPYATLFLYPGLGLVTKQENYILFPIQYIQSVTIIFNDLTGNAELRLNQVSKERIRLPSKLPERILHLYYNMIALLGTRY